MQYILYIYYIYCNIYYIYIIYINIYIYCNIYIVQYIYCKIYYILALNKWSFILNGLEFAKSLAKVKQK